MSWLWMEMLELSSEANALHKEGLKSIRGISRQSWNPSVRLLPVRTDKKRHVGKLIGEAQNTKQGQGKLSPDCVPMQVHHHHHHLCLPSMWLGAEGRRHGPSQHICVWLGGREGSSGGSETEAFWEQEIQLIVKTWGQTHPFEVWTNLSPFQAKGCPCISVDSPRLDGGLVCVPAGLCKSLCFSLLIPFDFLRKSDWIEQNWAPNSSLVQHQTGQSWTLKLWDYHCTSSWEMNIVLKVPVSRLYLKSEPKWAAPNPADLLGPVCFEQAILAGGGAFLNLYKCSMYTLVFSISC